MLFNSLQQIVLIYCDMTSENGIGVTVIGSVIFISISHSLF